MKKFTCTLALCALAFAGCSQDETTEVIPANSDHIRFRMNTTRATIIDLAALEASPTGFPVYATSGAAPMGWYDGLDGSIKYLKSGGAWGWSSGTHAWPTNLSSGYPMQFYAFFPATAAGMTINSSTPSSLNFSYAIQAESSQIDLMAAKAMTSARPSSGEIPLSFNHILSKINFKVIPGFGATVHIQSTGVQNVGNTRTYDLIAGDWTAAQPTAFTSNYMYKTMTKPATSIVGIDPAETTALPITPTNDNLMLMPQTATTWTPSTTVSNAHMSIIYRLTTATNLDAIGYTLATTHPLFSTLTPTQQAALTGKPLFVKVGYPFAANSMTWDPGKGYTYNIGLGTSGATNGYLLSDYYYDENGVVTPLKIVGKNVGDPISNGQINFTVSVNTWTDQSPTTIQ